MGQRRITVSLDSELVTYLDSMPNRSQIVAEAVRAYRARELERELERAYAEDHDEAAELATEWESTDAEVDE